MGKPLPPTSATYSTLQKAYDFFNRRLFEGELPHCLVTLQRSSKAYGYFAGDRFGSIDGDVRDEIALNPIHFAGRSNDEILSTLVHEMVHLWQHHFGQPSRSRYHNKEWAAKMEAIGLMPSDTGRPGGARVGQRVSHYIQNGGRFEAACEKFLENGFTPLYAELWSRDERKSASKTKFTCPHCEAKAWAKESAELMCGHCRLLMVPSRIMPSAKP